MSIQVGLYDFFAYTLPGILLLVIMGFVGRSFGLFEFDLKFLNELSTPLFLSVIAVSYILGMLLEPLAQKWYRLLQPRSRARVIFKEFEATHPDLNIDARPEEAGLMRAYIKQRNLDLALDIEKNGATNKMLRNFSVDFALLAIFLLFDWLLGGFNVYQLVGSLVAICLSFISASEAVKFDRWFHYLTLEAIAAFSLEPSNRVAYKNASSTYKFEERREEPKQPND